MCSKAKRILEQLSEEASYLNGAPVCTFEITAGK